MHEGVDFIAETNGRTVWINAADGMCIGRFSSTGVDVHRSAAEQLAGAPQCLDCIHDLPPAEAWERFCRSMRVFHGVQVRPSLRPPYARTR